MKRKSFGYNILHKKAEKWDCQVPLWFSTMRIENCWRLSCPTWYCPWLHHLTQQLKERKSIARLPAIYSSVKALNTFFKDFIMFRFLPASTLSSFNSNIFTEIWVNYHHIKLYTNVRHILHHRIMYITVHIFEREVQITLFVFFLKVI